jgi:hypothetical protein
MRKKLEILAAAAALAALAITVGAGAAERTARLNGPGTIRITDQLVSHIHVPAAGSDGGAGSFDFYRQLLYNKAITPHSIGHSDVTCIDTGTGSSNCSGMYFLPKGKIVVSGVIASRLFYELAVVGGTGLYNNVKGTLTATFLGGDPAQEFLLFRLVT